MFNSDYSWIQVVFKAAAFLSFNIWLLIFVYTMFLHKSFTLIVSIHLLKMLLKYLLAPSHIRDCWSCATFQHPHQPLAELVRKSSPECQWDRKERLLCQFFIVFNRFTVLNEATACMRSARGGNPAAMADKEHSQGQKKAFWRVLRQGVVSLVESTNL